jgi:Domain of Unknown Function (DUF1080)
MSRTGVVLSFLAFLGCAGFGAAAEPVSIFDGKTLTGWKIRGDEKKSQWKVGVASLDEKSPNKINFKEGTGELVNTTTGSEDIFTEAKYGDCIVEIEVMVPQGSNSGVYLMGEYEVQVLDSFGKGKVGPGDMGGIYSTAAPKVNASKKPGEWQKFVIDFQAPKFEGTKKVSNAKFIKVTLNDQVIHKNVEAPKPTGSELSRTEVPTGPLLLQGDHGPVAFRNIKIAPK